MRRPLARFHGGLHLDGHKAMSNARATVPAGLPDLLVLPLQQHIGDPAEPLVRPGDRVLKGQPIARASGYVSAPVHASSSGRVLAVEPHRLAHPSGLSAPAVVIEPDGEERWVERQPLEDYARLDPSALRNRIREAGIVGLGGAGFPSFIKLNPGPGRRVQTLILNGAECEPYITCDDRLMRERAGEVIDGARIIRHALGAARCLIGVEDDKPEALRALRAAADQDIDVVEVPTHYPTGGEKQLIRVLTGAEVPSDGLPVEIGVVVHNVATAAAVHRAVRRGEPLISRTVTVTGGGVARPGNLEVLLGTSVSFLLAQRSWDEEQVEMLLMGGSMMGFALETPEVPVVKTTNCLVAQVAGEPRAQRPVLPCIRCGACADACPVRLLPQQIYWYARARDLDHVQDFHLFDCIECGCCDYVCPSDIPLVSYFRYAKTEVWSQERERAKADQARRRHEAQVARRDRERREREALREKKRAALAARAGAKEDPKKAAIQAALERAKARQRDPAEPAEG